jgi:RNA polymerase sigma-70 factor (ECF subfamily)
VKATAEAISIQPDIDLIALCLRGNRNAFAPVVERYHACIFGFTYRYTRNREDAADLTQETFLRAFRSLNQYDSRFPLRNWLYTIATNACHDWARRCNTQPQGAPILDNPEVDSIQATGQEAGDPADIVIRAENTQVVENAVAGLPEEYRAPLILFYMEGLSQGEISSILQLPLTVVKNRLYRARLRLRQMLEGLA